ncbi:pilus assembly PilX family protein [Dyella sedimenti]|jgi:type IV pilus assembly protein PilX|uniref:pilus assembly PilX family protein n=1 Tax=Dyella sedimenti TaxID=2919947 RepID=UPI001FA98B13|nr:PilX N-terminal domain-containing pilus assembly protein [Dyella sedimenti]
MKMSVRYAPPVRPHHQRGAVLVVALIFLVLLTILAISASTRSLLQERMAGGLRNAQLAEMAAESALRGAEWRLWVAGGQGGIRCGSEIIVDCYVYSPANPIARVETFRTSAGWVTDGATEYKGHDGGYDYTTLAGSKLTSDQRLVAVLAHNPRYLIEDLGEERPPGTGSQHESGVTSSTNTGAGNPSTHIYRITARGVGGSENAVRVVESTFGAKSN